MKTVYEITKNPLQKNGNPSQPVKDKEKTVKLSNHQPHEIDQRRRWAKHFQEILNRTPPSETNIFKAEKKPPTNTNSRTAAGVIKAFKLNEEWKSTMTKWYSARRHSRQTLSQQ